MREIVFLNMGGICTPASALMDVINKDISILFSTHRIQKSVHFKSHFKAKSKQIFFEMELILKLILK